MRNEAVDYVAGQVGAADPSKAKEHLRCWPTRFEHQREIAREYGYTDFATAEPDLIRWFDHPLIQRLAPAIPSEFRQRYRVALCCS